MVNAQEKDYTQKICGIRTINIKKTLKPYFVKLLSVAPYQKSLQ